MLSILLLFAQTCLSQNSPAAGLTVNGIGLDAKYLTVIKKLGKPIRESTTRKIDECIGSRLRTLFYSGLKVELVEGERNDFTIFSFEVTSAKWNVSGTRVGDPAATVEKLFGKTGRTVEMEPTGPRWFYEMSAENPGGSNFYFRSGRVFKISSTYEMC